MTRYVAFLRAINVGGRIVRMEKLRGVVRAAGLRQRGNVHRERQRDLSDSRSPDEATDAAENRGGPQWRDSATRRHVFLRTDAEVAAVTRYQAFTAAELGGGDGAERGVFRRSRWMTPPTGRWNAGRSELDVLRVHGRELYWLCRTPAE